MRGAQASCPRFAGILPGAFQFEMLYEDRLDGFIEPAFFERKAQEWRQSKARITEQIAQYEDANQEYFKDGVRLLELSKTAYFLFKKAKSTRKAQIADFRVFELCLERSISHRNVPPTL